MYTAEQVRHIDRTAIEECGVPGFSLMQRAASAAFAALRKRWPQAKHIGLLAGSGNNGGDAFLLGTLALQAGLRVDAIALTPTSNDDAARARKTFEMAGGRIYVADFDTTIPAADVIVDGLFGTGLARPVTGVAAMLIENLNAARRDVLAIDLPSGLDANTGICLGATVLANVTISFIAWKRGLFTCDAVDRCGALQLAPLDVPVKAWDGLVADAHVLDDGLAGMLAPRRGNSNKSSFGHVLVIGGDLGMAGAVRLAGEAALRCGAGLVSVATRASHVTALNAARPELMAHGVDDPSDLGALIQRASVIAIGTGMGQGAWAQALFDAAIGSARPLVFDADALNLIARAPRALPEQTVLTPHPGEAARLLGSDVAAIQHDRFAAVREIAGRYNAVVVLKGAGSLIADPQGHVAVCPWGNPGMASGGMGDLLTGVVAALRAQGLSAWDAARLAVGVHARAGDIAAGESPRGLIASDLFVPLRQLVNGFA
ncbi:MAG: NAD(P)H-hydrate dehydratase [Dokdonella sp.]